MHVCQRITFQRKILETQENERKFVAQEIHDSIGGSLAAIKFALEEKLEAMGQNPSPDVISLEKIISHVDEAISESRRISANLRPSLLDDLGLLATISWFSREFGKLYPDLEIEQQLDVAEDEIPEMLKVVIYRVLQEAMNNVAKHSDAKRVRLHLVKQNNKIELSVADDGRGFDPADKFTQTATVGGFGACAIGPCFVTENLKSLLKRAGDRRCTSLCHATLNQSAAPAKTAFKSRMEFSLLRQPAAFFSFRRRCPPGLA